MANIPVTQSIGIPTTNSSHCTHCGSRFFKVLETRFIDEFTGSKPTRSLSDSHITMLYKKRCKRCKFKLIYEKKLPDGKTQPSSYERWQCGKSAETVAGLSGRTCRLFVGEYSQKVGRAADASISYLKHIRQQERKSANSQSCKQSPGGNH